VRVFQIDGAPDDRSAALHLVRAYLQLDCCAGDDEDAGHGEAADLCYAVVEALNDLPSAPSLSGVVTATKVTRIARMPDPDFSPARERFVVGATVTVHP
jgi:hypothetical protein